MSTATGRANQATGDADPSNDDVEVVDIGMERGFGGYAGANRRKDLWPYSLAEAETLPVAVAADYGPEPGRDPNYGSKGVDELVKGGLRKPAV
jgi:hypothetical protein